jgi:hypothetical protein
MPKIVLCNACGGKGKLKTKPPEGSTEAATIYLKCRSCNGTGWRVLPEEGDEEISLGGKLDVKSELESIESNPYRREETVPYLKLLIRLIDERFPAKKKAAPKKPKKK